MKKLLAFILIVIGSTGITFGREIGHVTTCKLTRSGVEFGAKSKGCSAAQQKDACDKYATKPQLGPSKPTGCKAFTSLDEFKNALKEAAYVRQDPQAAAAAKQVTPEQKSGEPLQLPVAVTCYLNKPNGPRTHFLTLANTCEAGQESCDLYRDVPHLGPAKKTTCSTFKDMTELQKWAVQNSARGTGLFPGFGGTVASCKTRANGILFNEVSASCEQDDTKSACQSAQNIADPIGCATFPTDLQVQEAVEKAPKLYGLECQMKLGGIGYRVAVPECSEAVRNEVCNPQDGTVRSCKKFSSLKAIQDWGEQFINEAEVTCKIKNMSKEVSGILARDCSPDSQKRACGLVMEPVYKKCKKREIEKLRLEMKNR